MAWQRYIDPPTGLLATGHVEMGAIYGHDGALWAASHGMDRVRYHELLELKNIFNNPKKGFSRGELTKSLCIILRNNELDSLLILY